MRDQVAGLEEDGFQVHMFQNRKRYGGMRDYGPDDTEGAYMRWKFQNRKRDGGMRDGVLMHSMYTEAPSFQNRKRYGGMRDRRNWLCWWQSIVSFKTASGMEACATTDKLK